MLVVVHHRDVTLGLEALLYLKALGRLDILEVDAAKGGHQRAHGVDKVVGIARVQLKVKGVKTCKYLKQQRLALHHRLARQRADIAQPEHGGTVGNHRHEIAAAGIFPHSVGIVLYLKTRIGHAGRVRQGQVAGGVVRLGGDHLDFAGDGVLMVMESTLLGNF